MALPERHPGRAAVPAAEPWPVRPNQLHATNPVILAAAGVVNRRPLARPREHVPQRPLWLCRACAGPWPCGEARLNLLRQHREDLTWLRIYLASSMHEALADLVRLNPYDVPTPEAAWNRFLAWAAPPTGARPARILPRRRSI